MREEKILDGPRTVVVGPTIDELTKVIWEILTTSLREEKKMSRHNPPTGKEKQALDDLELPISDLRKVEDKLKHSIASADGIPYSFAKSGIRVNGNGRVDYNLLDVLDILENCGDPKELRELADTVERIKNIAKGIRFNFEVCHECNGEKGAREKPRAGYNVGSWYDCDTCEGRGLLDRVLPQWAKDQHVVFEEKT